MPLIKKEIASFFSFSKKELNGLLVFCILIIAVLGIPQIYILLKPQEVFLFDDFKDQIARLKASEEVRYKANSYSHISKETKEPNYIYFEFNPNGLSASAWQQLGLSARQISVIKNYERKGGRFYKKEDLKKIFSITAHDYDRLEPYIRIPASADTHQYADSRNSARPLKAIVLVELNSADSVLLETINGIGPAFAARIIKYRNRLGGFFSKDQLKEVYGLDSVKYDALEQQVVVDHTVVKKININTATFDDLKQHPYLSFKQMNAIIQYRKQHGNFSGPADLRQVAIVNEETVRKLTPYLSF